MKARRSTRGRGRRVRRTPVVLARSAVMFPNRSTMAVAAAGEADALAAPDQAPAPPAPAPDETLYALGDGSDLPTIDVRADVAEAEA